MTVSKYIESYLKSYTPYKSYWCYEDACVLLGCVRMYEATGSESFSRFILDFLSPRVDKNGAIAFYPNDYRLDSFCGGRALLFAYKHSGEEKYRLAAEYLAQKLAEHPRCENGALWHKEIYPEQVWLDGIYMVMPFCAEYGAMADDEILRRLMLVRDSMLDTKKGLYYHGCDMSRAASWADKHTGLSGAFWLRGEGWLLMALADIAAALPECEEYRAYLREALDGILRYRDARSGMLFQVIDKAELDGNYTEASGSLMVAYALMRGALTGALGDSYGKIGAELFDCVIKSKLIDGNLRDICLSAGLGGSGMRDGTAEYYLSERRVCNDAKGAGVLMSAYAQKLLLEKGSDV